MSQKEMLEQRREELLTKTREENAQLSFYLELIRIDEMLSRAD